jgi:hypothetical protein
MTTLWLLVSVSDESGYISGIIETSENECISGDGKNNATLTTMHPMSRLHETAGDVNATILCFDGGGMGTGSCFEYPREQWERASHRSLMPMTRSTLDII